MGRTRSLSSHTLRIELADAGPESETGTRRRAAPTVTDESVPELAVRYQLFEAARRSADWTIAELWIDYLALGGNLLVFDLEGYLCGLMPMPEKEQDMLACALNERLTDLSEEIRVPYLTVLLERCNDGCQAPGTTDGAETRHAAAAQDHLPGGPTRTLP